MIRQLTFTLTRNKLLTTTSVVRHEQQRQRKHDDGVEAPLDRTNRDITDKGRQKPRDTLKECYILVSKRASTKIVQAHVPD